MRLKLLCCAVLLAAGCGAKPKTEVRLKIEDWTKITNDLEKSGYERGMREAEANFRAASEPQSDEDKWTWAITIPARPLPGDCFKMSATMTLEKIACPQARREAKGHAPRKGPYERCTLENAYSPTSCLGPGPAAPQNPQAQKENE